MSNLNPELAEKTLVKYLLFFSIIMGIVFIFYQNQTLFFTYIIINAVGIAILVLMQGNKDMFEATIKANRFAAKADSLGGKING